MSAAVSVKIIVAEAHSWGVLHSNNDFAKKISLVVTSGTSQSEIASLSARN